MAVTTRDRKSHMTGDATDGSPATPAPRDGLVTFDNVSFGYDADGLVIIDDISFSIAVGEVVTLLGASGCGKSTLLNMVAGLLSPRGGACLFEGAPIKGVNTGVGYMTQDDTLLPWRTVRANIALPLRLRGVAKSDAAARIKTYLRLLNLEDAEKQFPAQLSGGMKRRALMARTVIYEPRMILMDEPFAAIDADLREDLHVEVRKMVAELRQTVLFVTHDIAEAALLSDRVVVLAGSPVAGIADIVDVPFGPDRDLDALRTSPELFEVQKTLRETLRTGQPASGRRETAEGDGDSRDHD